MKDLFDPIVAEERLNPTFRKVSKWPGFEPGRLMANKVFQAFKDTDGNFVEQFQTTGFDSRRKRGHTYLSSLLYGVLTYIGCQIK